MTVSRASRYYTKSAVLPDTVGSLSSISALIAGFSPVETTDVEEWDSKTVVFIRIDLGEAVTTAEDQPDADYVLDLEGITREPEQACDPSQTDLLSTSLFTDSIFITNRQKHFLQLCGDLKLPSVSADMYCVRTEDDDMTYRVTRMVGIKLLADRTAVSGGVVESPAASQTTTMDTDAETVHTSPSPPHDDDSSSPTTAAAITTTTAATTDEPTDNDTTATTTTNDYCDDAATSLSAFIANTQQQQPLHRDAATTTSQDEREPYDSNTSGSSSGHEDDAEDPTTTSTDCLDAMMMLAHKDDSSSDDNSKGTDQTLEDQIAEVYAMATSIDPSEEPETDQQDAMQIDERDHDDDYSRLSKIFPEDTQAARSDVEDDSDDDDEEEDEEEEDDDSDYQPPEEPKTVGHPSFAGKRPPKQQRAAEEPTSGPRHRHRHQKHHHHQQQQQEDSQATMEDESPAGDEVYEEEEEEGGESEGEEEAEDNEPMAEDNGRSLAIIPRATASRSMDDIGSSAGGARHRQKATTSTKIRRVPDPGTPDYMPIAQPGTTTFFINKNLVSDNHKRIHDLSKPFNKHMFPFAVRREVLVDESKTPGEERPAVVLLVRESDNYCDASHFCHQFLTRAGGSVKNLKDYLKNEPTKAYIRSISQLTQIPEERLLELQTPGVKPGMKPHQQASWVHPLILTNIAQWVSPHMAAITNVKLFQGKASAPAAQQGDSRPPRQGKQQPQHAKAHATAATSTAVVAQKRNRGAMVAMKDADDEATDSGDESDGAGRQSVVPYRNLARFMREVTVSLSDIGEAAKKNADAMLIMAEEQRSMNAHLKEAYSEHRKVIERNKTEKRQIKQRLREVEEELAEQKATEKNLKDELNQVRATHAHEDDKKISASYRKLAREGECYYTWAQYRELYALHPCLRIPRKVGSSGKTNGINIHTARNKPGQVRGPFLKQNTKAALNCLLSGCFRGTPISMSVTERRAYLETPCQSPEEFDAGVQEYCEENYTELRDIEQVDRDLVEEHVEIGRRSHRTSSTATTTTAGADVHRKSQAQTTGAHGKHTKKSHTAPNAKQQQHHHQRHEETPTRASNNGARHSVTIRNSSATIADTRSTGTIRFGHASGGGGSRSKTATHSRPYIEEVVEEVVEEIEEYEDDSGDDDGQQPQRRARRQHQDDDATQPEHDEDERRAEQAMQVYIHTNPDQRQQKTKSRSQKNRSSTTRPSQPPPANGSRMLVQQPQPTPPAAAPPAQQQKRASSSRSKRKSAAQEEQPSGTANAKRQRTVRFTQ